MNANRFTAVIYKQGINPCVDVPGEITRALGRQGYIPVRGELNGCPFQATLTPVRNGPYRLFVNGEMRKRAGVDLGDEVSVVVELDPQPRTVPMPDAFELALQQNPGARAAFERLSPSRRKEILLYMNALKRPESLHRAIDRVLAQLRLP